MQKTQQLEAAEPKLFLPVRQSGMGWGGSFSYADGILHIVDAPHVYLEDIRYQPVQVDEVEFHIYRNGEEAFSAEGVAEAGSGDGGYTPRDWQWDFEAAPGDLFQLTLSCRDEYGLGYEFTLLEQQISPEGNAQNAEISGGETLRLFW